MGYYMGIKFGDMGCYLQLCRSENNSIIELNYVV